MPPLRLAACRPRLRVSASSAEPPRGHRRRRRDVQVAAATEGRPHRARRQRCAPLVRQPRSGASNLGWWFGGKAKTSRPKGTRRGNPQTGKVMRRARPRSRRSQAAGTGPLGEPQVGSYCEAHAGAGRGLAAPRGAHARGGEERLEPAVVHRAHRMDGGCGKGSTGPTSFAGCSGRRRAHPASPRGRC